MVAALSVLLLTASALSSVSAHAGHAPANYKRDNLAVRDDLETRCGEVLAARRRKRSLQVTERALARRDGVMPRQTSSNDSTCTVTPEVTQGPYHILAEIVRQNITEGQAGVPLEVNIDFFDVATCEPVQVWVDSWHANATGFYAGYIAETGSAISGGSGTGGGDMSMSAGPSGSGGGGMPTQTADSSSTTSYGAYSGADAQSAASMLNTDMDDNSTFLRGVYQSDEDGHITVYSIVPGWYSGRAQHYHIKAYPEGYIAENGTFIATGSAVHTGQFFFDNETLEAIAVTYPYSTNSIDWADSVTNNEDDQWYPYQAATGYNADMDITWVGDEITDGLIGSISVGLNMSYASPELSTQYAGFDAEEYYEEGMLPAASASAFA